MKLPLNLGRWLIETGPSKDELYDLEPEWDGPELDSALIEILFNWDDLTNNQSAANANWLIWTVFGDPFFLQHRKLDHSQTEKLIAGCVRVTRSIPRLHEPDQPMENGFFMLWDLMDINTQYAIDALAELLDHPDFRIQYAALHGLGHRGDSRIPIIQKYIQSYPEMLDDEFVNQCLSGTAM